MKNYFIMFDENKGGYQYQFCFDFSINFRNYHCVQLMAQSPFDTIAVWKIKRLKIIK